MNRSKTRSGRLTCAALVLAVAPWGAAWAHDSSAASEGDVPQEIQQRIHQHFSELLRSELALSDEQAERVLPLMTELEGNKRGLARERRETVQQLRTGMQTGASDAELSAWMATLEQLEDDQRSLERSALQRIDTELTTRQSVKLRFVVQNFRREVSERIHRRGGERQRHGAGPRQPKR